MSLSKEIGLRIRKERKELGWTREKLAEKAEISVQFLADIETGKSSMTTNTLYKVVLALGVTSDYIVFGADAPVDTSEISVMLSKLPKRDRDLAINILKNFVDEVTKTP